MTRYEAMVYFQQKGLTYADISRTDLVYLCSLLDLHFMKQRTERAKAGRRPYWLRTHTARTNFGEWSETGGMVCAYLTGRGTSCISLDVVSFHRNGHISLCSTARDDDAAPVLAAFVEWCDAMAEYKAFKKEDDHET